MNDSVLSLDVFSGTNDDERLAAAVASVAADTYKRPISLRDKGSYSFTRPIDVFDGFALVGPPRHGGQPRSVRDSPNAVNINTRGPWLRLPRGVDIYNLHVSGLSFQGSAGSVWMGNGPGGSVSGVLRTSVVRDVGFSLFDSIIGTPVSKVLLTANTFDGFWNVNNARDVSFTIGGSDNNLWSAGMLLDSPTWLSNGGGIPYHVFFDFMEKTNVGPIYVTCGGIPAGIRIDGSPSSGALVMSGIRVEGRSPGGSSLGSVVRVNGGKVTFRDAWLSYGFSDFDALPSAMRSGVRSGEGGVVTVTGGDVLFDACWYARAGADGVEESTPWIYATGSATKVRVVNARTVDDGGTFAGAPRVVGAASGATITGDGSTTIN